jgi:hypothetical protein
MTRNCVGSIYERSSIKIAHSVPIRYIHHIHVIIQNVKKWGIISIEKKYGAFNSGTYPHTFFKKHFTFKKKT